MARETGGARATTVQVVGGLAAAALLVVGLQLVGSSDRAEPVSVAPTTAVDLLSTTTGPFTDSTAAPTTPTQVSTTTVPPVTLEARNLLIRYDGDTGLGTLEAVVCNTGTAPASGFEVSIATAGQTVRMGEPAPLVPQTCAGYFDPVVDLAGFGIHAAGVHPTTVEVVDRGVPAAARFDVLVEEVAVVPDPDQFAQYQQCLGHDYEDGCADYVRYQPVPGEVMKRDGIFQAIAPAEVEALATFSVLDQQNCLPQIEQFLGIEGPRPISHRSVVADYYGAFGLGLVSWSSSAPLETYRNDIANNLEFWWGIVVDGKCGSTTAHELVHLILGQGPIPNYLEEGLATWMQVTERSNSSYEEDVKCREDAWYGWDWDLQADAWVPFSNLLAPDADAPGIYHYHTGKCFWDYIETEFGLDSVRQIVPAVRANHDVRYNGCSAFVESVFFLRDIVNPILGVDITPVTQERWGFGETFTSCEGRY